MTSQKDSNGNGWKTFALRLLVGLVAFLGGFLVNDLRDAVKANTCKISDHEVRIAAVESQAEVLSDIHKLMKEIREGQQQLMGK